MIKISSTFVVYYFFAFQPCECEINQVHVLPKHSHITNPTHTHTHTLQNQLKQPQYKINTKWS